MIELSSRLIEKGQAFDTFSSSPECAQIDQQVIGERFVGGEINRLVSEAGLLDHGTSTHRIPPGSG